MSSYGRLPIRTEPDLHQLLEEFKQHLQSRKLAEITVSTQMGGAKAFVNFLSGNTKPRRRTQTG